jgi:NitT/TauT family transport system permease protein
VKAWADRLAPTLFVGLLLGVWEALCRLLHTPSYFMPTPSAIAVALVQNAPQLFVSAGRTLAVALAAFALVTGVAGLAALGAASSRVVERSFRPLAVTLQVTPVVALAPLFQVWSGVDHPERAVISLAAIVGFFPIYSGALTGLSSADPELERLFDLYGASRWARLSRLRVPSAVPHVLEGCKVGLGLALVGAVVAEISAGSGGSQGLAWRIAEATNRLQMAKSFAALVALSLMAAVLQLAFRAFEKSVLSWWRGRPR